VEYGWTNLSYFKNNIKQQTEEIIRAGSWLLEKVNLMILGF
jgi:hypothetical protein